MLKQLFTAAALVATTATAGLAAPIDSIAFPMEDGCYGELIAEYIDAEGDVSVVASENCAHKMIRREAWVRCSDTENHAWFAEKTSNGGGGKWHFVEEGSDLSNVTDFACHAKWMHSFIYD